MDLGPDVRQFLTGMRARLTPEEAGVPMFGGERRVPGLRREEVAQLAGVSTAYYTRMERGNLRGVSESVLRSLARALRLNDAETEHLFNLTRAASDGARTPRVKPGSRLPQRAAQLLDAMPDVRYRRRRGVGCATEVGSLSGGPVVRRTTRVGESLTWADGRPRSAIRSSSSRAALAPIWRPAWSTLVSEIGPKAANVVLS